MVFNLPSTAMAQVLKPDLMYCGSSSRQGSDLYLGIGPFNEISGCLPDADTQALLITRSGTVAGNGAAWLAYLNSGGVVITEYSIHSGYKKGAVLTALFLSLLTLYSTQYPAPIPDLVPAVTERARSQDFLDSI